MLPALTGVASAQPSPALALLGVRPREDWAQGLAPLGEIQQERPEDVKFLLVHHTASGNGYNAEDVPGQIRSFYELHTGPDKNWPDVAYNFFVDRFGTIWEGRAGSLAGPVMPDATGGSQGFAQLGCLIGNHQSEAPSLAAQQAMIALLAALADTYLVETAPGSTTTFLSRGSNRWPAGASVTTATIAGHRDMSQTACPGEFAYNLVQQVFPTEVTALRGSSPSPPATTAASSTQPQTEAPSASGTTDPPVAAAPPAADDGFWGSPLPAVTGGALVGGTAGIVAHTVRRRRAYRLAPDGRTATDTRPIQLPEHR